MTILFKTPIIFDSRFTSENLGEYFYNRDFPITEQRYFFKISMNSRDDLWYAIEQLVHTEHFENLKTGWAIIVFDDTWEGFSREMVEQQITMLSANLDRIGIHGQYILLNSNVLLQHERIGRAWVYTDVFFESMSTRLWMSDHTDDKDRIPNINLTPQTLFVSMNRRLRPHRLYLVNQLLNHGLLDKGVVSLGTVMSERANQFHRNFSRTHQCPPVHDRTDEIMARLPMQIDDVDLTQNQLNLYADNRRDSFIHLVSETSESPATRFISEKTFRAIAFRQPFIIWGSPLLLAEMRKRGYRTFSHWWDESYDEEPNACIRMERIMEIMHQYEDKPDLWARTMKEMEATINYNYHLWLLQTHKCISTLNIFLQDFL